MLAENVYEGIIFILTIKNLDYIREHLKQIICILAFKAIEETFLKLVAILVCKIYWRHEIFEWKKTYNVYSMYRMMLHLNSTLKTDVVWKVKLQETQLSMYNP